MEDRAVNIIVVIAIVAILALKLCGVITISWLWLLSPIWVSFGLGCVLAFVLFIALSIGLLLERKK